MRFCVDVVAPEGELPSRYVHGVAHAVVYSLIAGSAPQLAGELHDGGWDGSTLRPVGISPPVFTGARHKPKAFMMSRNGRIWFGSPIPVLAASLLTTLTQQSELKWGPVSFTIKGVRLEAPDEETSTEVLSTVSPVLVKGPDGRFLFPGEDGWKDRLLHNIRHKADLLGLPRDADLALVEAGPRRRYNVSGGIRIGATATIQLAADPRLIAALREWGLGLGNIQGFGWIR